MTLYQHSRALNGVNVKTPKEPTVTISAETWRAVQQIIGDVATTYKTSSETFEGGQEEAFDQYEDIGFHAMLTAQNLGIPFNRDPNVDPDEDEDEDED